MAWGLAIRLNTYSCLPLFSVILANKATTLQMKISKAHKKPTKKSLSIVWHTIPMICLGKHLKQQFSKPNDS